MSNYYLDRIMENNFVNSLSTEEDISHLYSDTLDDNKKRSQKGGRKKIATGSFPPIYILDKKEVAEVTKDRELTTRKTAISIKDILAKKI